jgi:hypothetical protein
MKNSTSKNITYFLGAGASANAFPILSELSDNMVAFAGRYSKKSSDFSNLYEREKLSNREKLIWDIGYFGKKGIDFGTVDTYARKLSLNLPDSYEELNRLRLAISNFFTIWQYSIDLERKISSKHSFIDKRYYSLLATILENDKRGEIILNKNVNFISWNYDLQLELAYCSFMNGQKNLDDVNEVFSFNHLPDKGLRVCHLNGFHGFHLECSSVDGRYEEVGINLLNDFKTDTIDKILDKLSSIYDPIDKKNISLEKCISYAWDKTSEKNNVITRASEIMYNTDILIIIGYSFPNFNKLIDKQIFGSLNPDKISKIYYQDPDPNKSVILEMISNKSELILFITTDKNYFHVPYF